MQPAVEVGFAQESAARLSMLVSELGHVDAFMQLAMPEQIGILAHEAAAALEYQFTHMPTANKAGRTSHDRTGEFDDPSDWDSSYVHSIDTITVHHTDGSMVARVTMDGGGVWVWMGQRQHPIMTRDADWLSWKTENGDWVRQSEVDHPAVPRDPFVERTLDSLHGIQPLQGLLGRIESRMGFSFKEVSLNRLKFGSSL